jgi:hypothetical protein
MNDPDADDFESATIVLPVMNETFSLEETVRIILRGDLSKVREILIVVCPRTTADAMAVVRRLQASLPELVVVHEQTLPHLGGALREAFDLARGSHVVMMASDLETDPRDVEALIASAQRHPAAITAASRWLEGGSFHGYSSIKLLLNWIFQAIFALLYGKRLTDMTYGYRIYPTRLVKGIRWEELRHPFLFEALVKPLRLGTQVIEIPSVWTARREGESQNTFFANFVYFRTGLKSRLIGKEALLRASPPRRAA